MSTESTRHPMTGNEMTGAEPAAWSGTSTTSS